MLSTQMVTEKNKEVNKRREFLLFLDSLVQFIRIFAYFHYGVKNTLIVHIWGTFLWKKGKVLFKYS